MVGTGWLAGSIVGERPAASGLSAASGSRHGRVRIVTPGATPAGLILLFAALLVPFVVFYAVRLFHPQAIVFNEGWNAYHAQRLIDGEPLYRPFEGRTPKPLNYPPLSYLVIALLHPLTGNVVLTGRLLSYVSVFGVAALIWILVARLGDVRAPALLAGLVWCLLIAEFSGGSFGMNDPQLLGHLFSTAALLLYVQAQDEIDLGKLILIALLCSLALFTKLILVAVPIAISAMVLLRSRRHFLLFLACGTITAGLLALVLWFYAGPPVIQNILGFELARPTEEAFCGRSIFLEKGGAVFLIAAALVWATREKDWRFAPIYLVCALATGCYFTRGAVDVNAFFDLFIAGSILVGLVAIRAVRPPSNVSTAEPGPPRGEGAYGNAESGEQWGGGGSAALTRRSIAVQRGCWLLLLILPLPFLIGLRQKLPPALDYAALERGDREFEHDVEVLRSMPGSVLVEDPLLALSAGKEFEFDLFAMPRLIAAGYVPEATLVDPIREERFQAIVLYYDLEHVLQKTERKFERKGESPKPSEIRIGGRALGWRWTLNALREVAKHYRLLHHDSLYYFYLPRGSISG